MGRVSSGLVAFVCAGFFGVAAVAGCSADGSSALVDETSGAEPQEDNFQLPPSSGGGEEEADAGKPSSKDAGTKKDAAVDAGPPPPNPGDPCPKPDEIFKRQCGACGTQQALCLAGPDGGAGTVTDYGPCEGELAGGCIPGTKIEEACGNCGKQTRICTQYCAWTTTTCSGQPTNACTPGAVDLSSAGCGTDEYRQRTCSATCAYDNFSATCSAPPTFVKVPPTKGMTNSTIVLLKPDATLPRITSTCATSTPSTTISPPYTYIQVQNPNPKAATVTIYNSQAPGGGVIKTVLAAYDGVQAPTVEAARKQCLKGFRSYGTSSLTGNSSFASLDGTSNAVTIPANSTVSVFVGAYDNYDPAKPAETTGKVNLNVRLDTLAD